MYVKRVKRKCMMRGCKNNNAFSFSKTREMGNSIIICEECAKVMAGAIDDCIKKDKTDDKRNSLPPPHLFFEGTICKCGKCGKSYKTEAGLQKHICKSEE